MNLKIKGLLERRNKYIAEKSAQTSAVAVASTEPATETNNNDEEIKALFSDSDETILPVELPLIIDDDQVPPIEDNDIVEIKVNTNRTSSIFSNPCETCN